MGLVFNLFIIGQPLSSGDIINLNKNMAKIKNITPKGELNSNNSNKEVNLIKNKLFIYLLVN